MTHADTAPASTGTVARVLGSWPLNWQLMRDRIVCGLSDRHRAPDELSAERPPCARPRTGGSIIAEIWAGRWEVSLRVAVDLGERVFAVLVVVAGLSLALVELGSFLMS